MKGGVLLLIISLGLLRPSLAQPNDACGDATLLEVSPQCNVEEFSNANATSEGISVAPEPSCGSFIGADVWFKVLLPASGALRIEVDNPVGATPPSFTVYSGNCGNFQELVCVRNDHGKTIYQPSLAGALVYVRVYSYFSTNGGRFSLCVFEPEIPLADQCENAVLLTVDQSCQPEIYTNVYATGEPDASISGVDCGYYRGGDVWFKVVMPSSGLLRINKERVSGATHPALVAYTGSCNSFTTVFCSSNDPTVTIDDSSLAGQMLYLRLYSYASEEGSLFSLCLYEEDAPVNDNCNDALTLSVGSNCTMSGYTNRQATVEPSSVAPSPTCGSFRGGDVWFKVMVPASGRLRLETESGSGTVPPAIALYSGTCSNFAPVDCIENNKSFDIADQTLAGQVLTLRVFRYNDDNGANFFLCAFEPQCTSETIEGGEISICKGDSYLFGSQTITAAGEYTELFTSDTGCDSLVTIAVSVTDVNTSVISTGEIMTSEATEGSFQWVDCSSGFTPISGATSKTFHPDPGGEYAVIVSQNLCSDTSACYTSAVVVGVTDDVEIPYMFFPNPVDKVLYVDLSQSDESVSLELIDLNGSVIKTSTYDSQALAEVDTRRLASGLYMVRLQTEKGISIIKIIKK